MADEGQVQELKEETTKVAPEIQQLAQEITKEPEPEAKHEKPKRKKEWRRLEAGEIPKVGERCSSRDGEGVIDWIHGPNIQLKLDSGYLARMGIDAIRVLR